MILIGSSGGRLFGATEQGGLGDYDVASAG